MNPKLLLPSAALAISAAVLIPLSASAAEKREKIAVMKVDAPALSKDEVSSLRDRLEVGVTRAVGSRLQVITRDSAAASVGGDDKLLACMESASCDAEIGGALGVDYFVSASVRQTTLGLELGVSLLRTAREVSLLKKEVKAFASMGELLRDTSAHAESVTRDGLGGEAVRPGATTRDGLSGEVGRPPTQTSEGGGPVRRPRTKVAVERGAWRAEPSFDPMLDTPHCRVTVAPDHRNVLRSRRGVMASIRERYPVVETRGDQILVGVVAEPKVIGGKLFPANAVGDVQLRVDDNPTWSILPAETPDEFNKGSGSSDGLAAFMKDNPQLQTAMAAMTGGTSPRTLTTGVKAAQIVEQMKGGSRIVFRTKSRFEPTPGDPEAISLEGFSEVASACGL